jgi:hypothetical protein
MNYRTITMGPRSKTLHIEAPGCIINICQVEDATGRPVTRVDVNANADRYAGEPEWWALVGLDPKPCRGVGVRVIKGVKVQAEDEANARLIAAAPELLEALIALLCSSVYAEERGVMEISCGGPGDETHREIVEQARSAIAKAQPPNSTRRER